MHRPPTARATALAAALVVLTACSSSGRSQGSGYSVARLEAVLVTAHDVELSGFTLGAPDGGTSGATTYVNEFFSRTRDAAQLSVSLVATGSSGAARAASRSRLAYLAASLRGGGTHRPVAVGLRGVEYTGRAKIGGALETSVYFTEGRVVVQVALVAPTPTLAPSAIERVARAQDAKLERVD